MDPTSFLGVGTWLADKVAGSILGRPRLTFTIRSDDRGPWFAIGNRVSPPLPSVVIRAINVGRLPIEVETIGIELDNQEFVTLEGGDQLPVIIAAPGHVERDESRKALIRRVGAQELRWLVAIGTDGRRYRSAAPRDWRNTGTWPE
jgi:hypothetical protein